MNLNQYLLVQFIKNEDRVVIIKAENQQLRNEIKILTNLTKTNCPLLSDEERKVAWNDYQVASQPENTVNLSAQFK